jgi:hypothetical protein
MTKETVDETRRVPPPTYPPLDPVQTAAINAKLVAIAVLRHPGELTTAQLADLTAAIQQQTRHLETLHRFPLTNADEPAFIRSPPGAAR